MVATIVNTSMTQQAVHDWAGVWPFLLGGRFLRWRCTRAVGSSETPIFLEMQQRKALGTRAACCAVVGAS
ncbi:hypothetical protein KIF59_12385 [Enterobacter cloacae subsp. cloacae]|nr:hypothetical protein [Enterobacter cloacae subsp. cloacae]